MKKIINAENIAFLVLTLVLFIMFFVPPVIGVSDNGDFERVMTSCGIKSMPMEFSDQFYYFVNENYEKNPIFLGGTNSYVTTHVIPIRIARLFQWGNVFNTKALATVYSIIFLFGVFFILKAARTESTIKNFVLGAFIVFILGDATKTVYFNSFYGEASSYVFLLLMSAAGIYIIKNGVSGKNLVAFFVSSALFFGSKLQYTLFSVLLLVFLIPIMKVYVNYRAKIIAGFLAVVVFCGAIYFIAPKQLSKDTTYNSVFYGILKNSPSPEEDLKYLGLSTEFSALSNTNAYSKDTAIDISSNEFNDAFYNKISRKNIMLFYLTHPKRFFEKMDISSKYAFDNKRGMYGNYLKSEGRAPGEKNSFFTQYNDIKAKIMPKKFWGIALYYFIYLIGMILVFVHKKDKRLSMFFLFFILFIGICQFPLPILGNGEADIYKQLFIFNATFDISILVLIYVVLKYLIKRKKAKL